MSKPIKVVLWQDNTQALLLTGLQDIITGAWLNAATVTATLLDENGQQVPGCTNIQFTYQPLSDGNYTGIVGQDFEAPVGGGYVLTVDADQAGAHLHMEIPAEVQARTD